MFNHNCLVCMDKKKFNRKVSDAQRIHECINREIRFVLKEAKGCVSEQSKAAFKRNIMIDKSNVRFMCGRCSSINTMELTAAENRIKDDLSNALDVLEYLKNIDINKAKKVKNNLLRILQGYYPKMWHELNRYNINN